MDASTARRTVQEHLATRQGTEVVDRERGAPKRQLPRTIQEPYGHQQGGPEGGGRGEPHHGA
jgi:hypothetical protein